MENQNIKPTITLLKITGTSFKLIISNNLESKIRQVCSIIHDKEWSGTLFYKVTGSIEGKDLIVTALDFIPLDIGNSGYTEYNESPDTVSYMVDHPELLEEGIYTGLIHSHNTFATFFSNTDEHTLLEEGSERNHFVSLIVNNEGKYTAAITVKKIVIQHITEEYTYKTFEDKEVKGNRSLELKKEKVFYYNLIIEKPESYTEVENQLKRISETKTANNKIVPISNRDYNYYDLTANNENKFDKQLSFDNFDDFSNSSISTKGYSSKPLGITIPKGKIDIDKNIVTSIVNQILTGNIVTENSVTTAVMEKRYARRFPVFNDFQVWADTFIEFLLITNNNCEDLVNQYGEELIVSLLATEVEKALSTLASNKYLDCFLQLLSNYI